MTGVIALLAFAAHIEGYHGQHLPTWLWAGFALVCVADLIVLIDRNKR